MAGVGLQFLNEADIRDSGDIKEQVYAILKKMIMTREFTPNERLDAHEIAKRLNVSRTPVRDALNMLDAEGFIITVVRKGTFVTGVYKKDLIELFEQREMIELYSLQQGFSGLVKSVDKLSEGIEQWERETSKPDYDGAIILDTDVQIHRSIVRSSGNNRIYQSYEALNCHVHMARGYYMQEPQRIHAAHLEHKEIYQAVIEQDLNKSKLKLKTHIDNTLESLLKLIDVFKVF